MLWWHSSTFVEWAYLSVDAAGCRGFASVSGKQLEFARGDLFRFKRPAQDLGTKPRYDDGDR